MATTPARASQSVVAVKLHPGVTASQLLERPQLDLPKALLDNEASAALLCAPGGYGKSTVMAQWHGQLQTQGIASAWLSLDADDNDPARFLRYFIAALQGVHRQFGSDVLAQLSGALTAGTVPLLESLAADLGRVKKRTVLFLDDVHCLQQAEVLDMLQWLVSYSPATLQYVLGSRTEPPLKLSSLRVRRKLLEVDTAQLKLSAEEAAQLLALRLGRPLTEPVMQQLMLKTEGWVAALELLVAALHSQSQPEDLIAEFAGTDLSVVDYLGDIVLQGLGDNLRSFVARIAQFDSFCAALAAQVTGSEQAAAQLAELQARNLFLVPLDRQGEWFRFHHLVGQFFREHLRRNAPEEAISTLSQGASWLHAQGRVEDAINAAIRAAAFDQAAAWIDESVEDLVYRHGYHHTLTQWMNALPQDCVDRYPGIRINYAFSLAFLPQHREVEAQLHRLEAIATRLESTAKPDRKLIDGIRCAVELQQVLSHGLRDEGLAARDSALAWLEHWPDAPAVQKGHVSNALGFGHKSASEIDAGLKVMAQGRQWHLQGEGFYGLAWNAYVEAVLHMKRGTYQEAKQTCLAGLELIRQHLNGHRSHASLLHTILAAVAYEFDEADQARAHSEQAMRSVQYYGPADAVILAYLTQARLHFLAGDSDSAYAILQEGQELGRRRELQRVCITLAAEECTWLGRTDRFDDAMEVAQRCGILKLQGDSLATTGLIDDKSARVAWRLKLHAEPDAVATELSSAIGHARELGLHHRHAELLGMRAVAHARSQQLPLALADMNHSLEIAASRQYLRTYLDEGKEVAELLQQMSAQSEDYPQTMPLVRRLQRSFERSSQSKPSQPGLVDGLLGELTKRELNLLKRLESGMSNKEIAESVFITEGTLKWHLTNIYSKLGTKNRSGALVKARGLALI